jgi:hypothetical protein
MMRFDYSLVKFLFSFQFRGFWSRFNLFLFVLLPIFANLEELVDLLFSTNPSRN